MRTILGTRAGKSRSLRTPPGTNSPVVGDTTGTRSPGEVRTARATSSWAEEPVLSVARRRELGSPSWHVGHPKVTAVLTGQRELRHLHFMGFRDNKEPPCPRASVCTHKSALVLLSPLRSTPKMLPPSRRAWRDAPERTARL